MVGGIIFELIQRFFVYLFLRIFAGFGVNLFVWFSMVVCAFVLFGFSTSLCACFVRVWTFDVHDWFFLRAFIAGHSVRFDVDWS